MRFVLTVAVLLTACSPGDDQKVKADARKAAAEIKTDAQKASREIDKGIRETREKVRKAVDAKPDDGRK